MLRLADTPVIVIVAVIVIVPVIVAALVNGNDAVSVIDAVDAQGSISVATARRETDRLTVHV